MSSSRHPHIVFIYCDELRADMLERSEVDTPALDRLRQNAVWFPNCFVQSPLCLPSRASLATGRYASSHGAHDNYFPLAGTERTLYAVLQDSGFETVNYGKAHLGRDPLASGFAVHQDFEDGTMPFGIVDAAERRSVPHKRLPGNLPLIISGTHPRPASETKAAQVVSACLERLQGVRDGTAPLFLRASIAEPHTPILPPRPYDAMYDPATIELPASLRASLADKPWLQRFYAHSRRFDALAEEDYRRCRASYFGLVSHVDAQIGRLLHALEAHDLIEDAIVVFTSDHGSMLGEHGWIEKWGHFYDPVVRVPLLIRFPDGSGRGARHDELAESVDILPTLLNYLGIEVPARTQGTSMLPFIRGETDRTSPAVFSEFRSGSLMAESAVMIRTDRWKLCLYPDPSFLRAVLPVDHPASFSDVFDEPFVPGELYDLHADPFEVTNLYDSPEHAVIRARLEADIRSPLSSPPRSIAGPRPVPLNDWGYFQLEQGDNFRRVREALRRR